MSPDEELRWVRVRKRTHRSGSKETPGYDRDLLRDKDTGNLLGPTESRPADIDEIIESHTPAVSPRATARQEFRYQVGDAIMDALTPYIERGASVAVDGTVLGVSKLWRRAASKSAQRKNAVGYQSPSATAKLEATPVEATSDGDAETGTSQVRKPSVTADQYQAILLSARVAEQYAANVRQLLAEIVIREGDVPAESAIQAALEGPASSIDEATFRRVVEVLGGSRNLDPDFMLVKGRDTSAPLRTIDGRPQQP